MPLPQAQLPRYTFQIITTTFQIQGRMETVGPLLDFLNDKDRQFFILLDATAKSLTPGPMGQMTLPQLIVPKTDVIALVVEEAAARTSLQLLKRVERCILYMPLLVCRGEFHLGADTRWTDMVSLVLGNFFAFTNAAVFPLAPLPGPFPQQTELVILNRQQIRMLHLDQA
jgi:hypothetical protein